MLFVALFPVMPDLFWSWSPVYIPADVAPLWGSSQRLKARCPIEVSGNHQYPVPPHRPIPSGSSWMFFWPLGFRTPYAICIQFVPRWSESFPKFRAKEGLFRPCQICGSVWFSSFPADPSISPYLHIMVKVTSAIRISVFSARHADPHAVLLFPLGRNIVSRPFGFM